MYRTPAEPPRRAAETAGLRVTVTSTFELPAYPHDDDPLARCLLGLEVEAPPLEPSTAARAHVAADVFLVLDVSGSMNNPAKYPMLRRAVEQLLAGIAPDDRVGIVLFSSGEDLVTPLVPGSDARGAAPVLLARMDGSPVKWGSTYLAPGLRRAAQALAQAGSHGPRRIYVLTDGELHDPDRCLLELDGLPRQGIEVHVYGFGTDFNAAALKRMVSDQLGGSVKPIVTERDIVDTFAHIAQVNSRLVAHDAALVLEFDPQVDCGDAWTFRPQERHLGPVRDRALRREFGGLESGRRYELAFEVRLPPAPSGTLATPVVRARLEGRRGDALLVHDAGVIVAPRAPASAAHTGTDARVAQAFAVLESLRREGDRDALVTATRARIALAEAERRDPGLVNALRKQLDVYEGRASEAALGAADRGYLDADLSTALISLRGLTDEARQ